MKNHLKNLINEFLNEFLIRPILTLIPFSVLLAFTYTLFVLFKNLENIYFEQIIIFILISILLIIPIALTLQNLLFFLIHPSINEENIHIEKRLEALSLLVGILFSIIIISFNEIKFVDWNVKLVNSQLHSPIYLKSSLTIIILLCLSIRGYFYCRFKDLEELTPLGTVLSISFLYIGIIISTLISIQLFKNAQLISFFFINCIILNLKTIRQIIHQKSKLIENNNLEKFPRLNELIRKSSNWPLLSFVLIIPLLGGIILILILFGQRPDSLIKAWTETSDWTLSQRVSPQNIHYDEHYLCTVAAGGHKRVVKPIRYGKRHGHKVIVNRQLCVANAFEQIIEEKIPKIHRVIRNFYDKYGYPISKNIKSPYIADLIYFLMKPLEIFFLITLYLFDKKPENRIAIQYPHKPLPKL